jgi:hypothetical protein
MIKIYVKTKDFKEPKDEIYYLVTADGIFLVKKNQFFKSSVRVEGISMLAEHKEDLKLNFQKKIPNFLMEQIIAFFKEVWRCYKSEAVALIYFSLEKLEYKVVIPKQKVNNDTCQYELEKDNLSGFILFATCHSHLNFTAFHSPIDDKDEEYRDGFHITIGNLDLLASFSCSAMVCGQRFGVEPAELIEGIKEVKAPEEWFLKVEKGKPLMKFIGKKGNKRQMFLTSEKKLVNLGEEDGREESKF